MFKLLVVCVLGIFIDAAVVMIVVGITSGVAVTVTVGVTSVVGVTSGVV